MISLMVNIDCDGQAVNFLSKYMDFMSLKLISANKA